jgi:hypothetical protein
MTAPRETCVLATLLGLLKTHSKNQIKWVLTIIPDAYCEEKGQMRSMLIKTLAATLKQDPKLDREGMIEALRQNDPEDLQTNAAACVRAQGGRALTYMVEILMRSYHAAVRRSTTTGRSLLTAMAGYDPPPLCRDRSFGDVLTALGLA